MKVCCTDFDVILSIYRKILSPADAQRPQILDLVGRPIQKNVTPGKTGHTSGRHKFI